MEKLVHRLFIFILINFISLNAQDFWQATSVTTGAGAFAGRDGYLYFTNGVSLYRTLDYATTWDSLLTLPSGTYFNGGLATTIGNIFIATNGSGMIRSTDDGATWSAINTGFSGTEARWPTMSPSGTLFIGSVSNGIFRSTNNGDSWTQVNSGLTNLNIGSLAVTSSGILFTGVKGSNGVFTSTDNGDSWTQTSLTTSVRIYSLSVDNNGYIYAGSRYDPNAPNPNGFYRSTDNGGTWTHYGLAGQSINTSGAIFVNGKIYAATDANGIFKSADNGATWDSINTGLPTRGILTLSLSNGHLFAGTYNGLFKSSENVTAITEDRNSIIPSTVSLLQNYPNPFNPTTNFGFRIANFGLVTMKVFDVLGREVATLVNEELHPGMYSVTWDASAQPSGMYYYKLQTADVEKTKPMVLIK
ncbi:MAG: T9SS type A sorting domain-containing protein [Ignavibacteriae bacterium]|nr:T9SS type A sorting domain-containing protein [Ignavibacteriota bacterium]